MPELTPNIHAVKRRDRLTRIYRAFEALIYAHGYSTVTLADVAEKAGLARTSMYKYFTTKEDLLLSYTAREMDDYHSLLRVDLARANDPFDQLDIFVAAQVNYFAVHHMPSGPALRSLLPVDAYQRLRQHGVVLEETLRAILDQAAQEGMIPQAVADDPNTVRTIQSCLSVSATGAPMTKKALRELVVYVQQFVRRAVGANVAAA